MLIRDEGHSAALTLVGAPNSSDATCARSLYNVLEQDADGLESAGYGGPRLFSAEGHLYHIQVFGVRYWPW